MSLVDKIYKELRIRANDSYWERKKLKYDIEMSDNDVISSFFNEDKRFNKLKTDIAKNKVLMSFFFSINYNVFKFSHFQHICNIFGHDLSLKDYLAIKSFHRFYSNRKITIYENAKNNFIKNNLKEYVWNFFFQSYNSKFEINGFEPLALMIPDFYKELVLEKIKEDSKVKDFDSYTRFLRCPIDFYLLSHFFSEDVLKNCIKTKHNNYVKYYEKNRDICGTSESSLILENTFKKIIDDNFEHKNNINKKNWLNYLDEKIDHTLEGFSHNSSKRTETLQLMYKPFKNRYEDVILFDSETLEVFASIKNISSKTSIEDIVEKAILSQTIYSVDSIEKNETGSVIKLKVSDTYKTIEEAIEKINAHSSFSISHLKLARPIDEENALIIAFTGRASSKSKDEIEYANRAFNNELDFLGEVEHLKETTHFSTGCHLYKLKINSESINSFLKNFKPVKRLEKGKLYRVTKDDRKYDLKEGTIFSYLSMSDVWRNNILIHKGSVINGDGTETEYVNREYKLFDGGASGFTAKVRSVPYCQEIEDDL